MPDKAYRCEGSTLKWPKSLIDLRTPQSQRSTPTINVYEAMTYDTITIDR
jgi:hypothetical protein